MSRRNRKGSDDLIIRLNNLGFSLVTISEIIGCHPTAITLRLKNLGIKPIDARRTFMEEIYTPMSETQQEWIADLLTQDYTIKEYLSDLLNREFAKHKAKTNG